MIIETIVKYWLQFALGIIASGLTGLCSYFYHLYKKEKMATRAESEARFIKDVKDLISDNNRDIMKVIREEEIASEKSDEKINSQMEQIHQNLTILTEGMLSIQGRQFKDECRALLKDNHIITLQEFENLSNEHRIYNCLKGNHEGDSLFSLVKVKYEAGLANPTE